MSNLKLMHISCLIHASMTYDVLLMLRQYKAMNVESRPVVEKSESPTTGSQQAAIIDLIRDQITAQELTIKSGVSKSLVYAAISRALRMKQIRRIRPGVYAPNKTKKERTK